MSTRSHQARAIFLEAIERSPQDRVQFLEAACAGDADLRARVERLLRSHELLGSFHDNAAEFAVTVNLPLTETEGTQIGSYKLLEQIGEGGMGVVWMAEQLEPVRRKVALKVIKPGMDTRQVIARFEAERQALSLMDHPHIAKVLDAGATDSGRPYFVMELVKGQPITQYCDENHLTPRQRLELLLPVCQAIQHAHQKGIIHRDIKPSNVLVAEYDERAVPKVIDFGVSKAICQPLTQKTMFTGFGQLIGTLEYMSPEQAKVNQLDIDTRSDIYSLGVLLYELLTGTTPFDKIRLRSAAWEEMLRIIRDEEPKRPSVRLSDFHDTLPSISALRLMEPLKLTKLVRGELDWIVMKAIDKDRNRRYETANGFAADIQRYLSNEPVQACPPSAGYCLTKFARRNRGALLTTAVIALALVFGTVISTWQAIRATHAERLARDNETRAIAEEQKAKTERERAETNEGRAKASEIQAEADFQKALDAVDRLLFRVGDESLRNVPQMEQVQEKILRDALEFYEKLLAELPRDPKLRFQTAKAYMHLIGFEKGNPPPMLQRAHEMFQELHVESPDDVEIRGALAGSYDWLGWRGAGNLTVVENCHRRAIELLLPLKDSLNGDVARSYRSLAENLRAQGRFDEAEEMFRKALNFGSDEGHSYHGLANLLEGLGRDPEAIEAMNRAIEVSRSAIDDDSSKWRTNAKDAFAWHCLALGQMLMRAQRPEESLPHLMKSEEVFERLKSDFPTSIRFSSRVGNARTALIQAYHALNRDEEARLIVDQFDPDSATEYFARARQYQSLGAGESAIADFSKAIELAPTNAGYYQARASEYAKQKQSNLELADRTKALELDPTNAYRFFFRGETLLKLEEFEAALGDFDAAITMGAKDYWYKRRAQAQFHLGHDDLALADLGKALELNPKDGSSFTWIAPELVASRQDSAFVDGLLKLTDKHIEAKNGAANVHATHAEVLAYYQKYERALAEYAKSIELDSDGATFTKNRGFAYNNSAWILANCPDLKFRDSHRAVGLAQKAVKLDDSQGGSWNTLGACQYRAGNWQLAIDALQKSMELGQGGNSFDWFFLAMSHWQLGEKETARKWHEQAVAWMEKNQPKNPELLRFRAEAEELLKAKPSDTALQ